MNKTRLIDQLKRHEGVRNTVYKDSLGIETIGVGRNLRDVGLSPDEIDYLLENDLKRCERELRENFYWFEFLEDARQEALLNLCFNVGISRLKGFKKMLVACEKRDWEMSAEQAKDSKWFNQVGNRGVELVEQLRSGFSKEAGRDSKLERKGTI